MAAKRLGGTKADDPATLIAALAAASAEAEHAVFDLTKLTPRTSPGRNRRPIPAHGRRSARADRTGLEREGQDDAGTVLLLSSQVSRH